MGTFQAERAIVTSQAKACVAASISVVFLQASAAFGRTCFSARTVLLRCVTMDSAIGSVLPRFRGL